MISRALRPFQRFVRAEAAGGIVLIICTAIALVWANSPWWESYFTLWETPLSIGGPSLGLTETLHHWINDGLMAVFFFLVGLEIKRELLIGELASVKQAALPLAAAVGGMIVPAAIYAALNAGGAGARGWGIPMATDIAFALGVVALLGPRVPVALRVFLTALAIVDDLGSVLVIAIFYTSAIAWRSLAVAGGVLLVLALLNRARVRHLAPYVLLGVALWVAFLKSGVHATVAGVALAMTIPARTRADDDDPLRLDVREGASEAVQSPLQKMEHRLNGVVAFAIVPLFALANAGVRVSGGLASGLSIPIALGVVLGLLLGKPIGITLASWLAVRTGAAALPSGASWRLLHGVSWLGGIGFTMSLFIAELAFGGTAFLDSAKIGILLGSILAGFAGWSFLRVGELRGRSTP